MLIGGVWPSIVSLMVGAGLGFNKEDKGPDYDLDRFKGEEAKKPGAPQPTAADMQHLRDLESELEKARRPARDCPFPRTKRPSKRLAFKSLPAARWKKWSRTSRPKTTTTRASSIPWTEPRRKSPDFSENG